MRGFLLACLLLALSLASTWLLWTVQETLQDSAGSDSAAPLVTMEDFQATRMSEQGVRLYTLTAPYLEYRDGGQGTEVLDPDMLMYRADGLVPDWRLTATRGWLAQDYDEIRLRETVTLVRDSTSGKLPLTIDARDVIVRPREDIVESSAPVRLTSPDAQLLGVGFRAYLDTQQVELLSDVRGRHSPPKP